jgi:ESCRT-II complex subunit VPS36
MSNRQIGPSITQEEGNVPLASEDTQNARAGCPRCTFENDPSLLNCEICGASLVITVDRRIGDLSSQLSRSDSPGPILKDLNLTEGSLVESIKFSFRAGGEKIFLERLKGALVQRKWLLSSAPPIPKPLSEHEIGSGSKMSNGNTSTPSPAPKMVGIAGLERRGQELRKNNEVIIGNAFEDLEALKTSAKEVIALAESFAALNNADSNNQSTSALGLVTTKDMLASDSLYVSELSRNLAEFLTDDTKGILKREGGIMSLVDLWAMFNRLTPGGVELVSPSDFFSAAELWDKLKLPVRLRRFKSGLLVVQGRDRTDEKTVMSLLSWLRELRDQGLPVGVEVSWDWAKYGKGVTAQETAERFGWSVGVANEELEMAEERGALCRDQGLDGVRWWENWLVRISERDSPG